MVSVDVAVVVVTVMVKEVGMVRLIVPKADIYTGSIYILETLKKIPLLNKLCIL